LAKLISEDEIKRLQKHLSRLMQDLGVADLESKYLEEMKKIQARMSEIMAEPDVIETEVMVPLADIKETNDAIIVIMDIPGVDKKDVEISVSDNELRMVAKRKVEKEIDEKGYYKHERSIVRFERMVKLPIDVKSEEAKARLDDGVLEVTIPKVVVTSRKRITIE
jgi:HSP20 family protein